MYILEKQRLGFGETNSSSCHSFTISGKLNTDKIKEGLLDIVEDNNYRLKLSYWGKKEFGWEIETNSDIASIYNYYLLTACYTNRIQEFKQALEEALQVELIWQEPKENEWDYGLDGYIDHQSSDEASWELAEFIHSKDLKYFDAIIKTDNDNH